MRQGLKEWQMMQSIMTGGSTDVHDIFPLGEPNQPIRPDIYTSGEGRRLAKNMGR